MSKPRLLAAFSLGVFLVSGLFLIVRDPEMTAQVAAVLSAIVLAWIGFAAMNGAEM